MSTLPSGGSAASPDEVAREAHLVAARLRLRGLLAVPQESPGRREAEHVMALASELREILELLEAASSRAS